ncbi:MAG: hypothetical protein D6681_20405, partial [Calditrichaeota bacterium]
MIRSDYLITALILVLLWGIPLAAQEAETDTTLDSCRPASLETPYDTTYSPSVNPEQLKIWYDYARDYYIKARYEKRDKYYRHAIPYYWRIAINDTIGTFKVAYSKLAECYYNLNEPDSVLIAVYRGLERFPDYPALHYYAGLVHRNLGRTECAIPHYEALVKAGSNDPKVLKSYYEVLAQLYFQIDDPRAIEAQQKVTELDPNDTQAQTLLGQMLTHFGEDPLPALEAAFLNDTTNVVNAFRYGRAAYEAGEYGKALRAFRALLHQSPENTEALGYLARSYEGLDQFSKAVQVYRQILKIKPDDVNTLCALASVYARMHQFTTARSYVQRALRINPRSGLAYMVLGEIYENAVSYCSARREEKGFTYDDKLVYEKAREA